MIEGKTVERQYELGSKIDAAKNEAEVAVKS